MSSGNSHNGAKIDEYRKKALLEEANNHYKARRYKEALEIYEQIILLAPNDARGFVGKGDSLRKLEQYDCAERAYEQAIAIDPQYASAYSGLCYLYVDRKDYDKALSFHEKAIELDPLNAAAYNGKGQALYYSKDCKEALNAIEKAINLATDRDNIAAYYFNKSLVLYDLHRYQEALITLEKAIELDPTNVKYQDKVKQFNLASSVQYLDDGQKLYDEGKFEEALLLFEKILSIDNTYTPARIRRGNTLIELGRYDEALQTFHGILRFQPTHAFAYIGIGQAYLRLKRFEEAIQAFNNALRYNSKLAQAYAGIGHAHLFLKHPDKALEAFEAAIKFNTDDMNCYLLAAEILFTQQAYEKALQMYEEALQRAPEHLKIRLRHAQTLFTLQRYQEALAAYEQITVLDSSQSIAHMSIGDILSILNMPEAATQAYEKAFQLLRNKPDRPTLWLLATDLSHPDRPAHVQFQLLLLFLVGAFWNEPRTFQALQSIADLYESLFLEGLAEERLNSHVHILHNLMVHLSEVHRAEALSLIAYKNDKRLARLLILLAPYSLPGLNDLAHQLAQRWIARENTDLGIRLYHVLDRYGVPFEVSDWLFAQELTAKGFYIQVKSILADLVKQHSTPERLWLLIRAMQHRRDPIQEQMEALRRFLDSTDPSDLRRGEAWQRLGDLLLTQGEDTAAIEAYRQAESYGKHIPQLQAFRLGDWDMFPTWRRDPDYPFPPVVVLDLENDYTPDAAPGSRVFEIGAVRVKGDTELASLNLVIQRDFVSPKVAHRQDEAVKVERAIRRLQEFIGSSIVVGHNLRAFDAPHLRAMGLSLDESRIIDTLTFARLLYPESVHHHLQLLREYHHIPCQGKAHTALPDAQACAHLLHALGDELLRRGERLLAGFRAFVPADSAFDRAILQPRQFLVDSTAEWDLDSEPAPSALIVSLKESPASPRMLEAIAGRGDFLVEYHDPNAAYVRHLPPHQKLVVTVGTRTRLEQILAMSHESKDMFVLPDPQTLLCPQLLRQQIEQTSSMALKLTLFCLYQASHNHDASTLYPLRIPVAPTQQEEGLTHHDENGEEAALLQLRQLLLASCCGNDLHHMDSCPAHTETKKAAQTSRLLIATHQNFLCFKEHPEGMLIIVDDADQLQMRFAEYLAQRVTDAQIRLQSPEIFQLLNDVIATYVTKHLNRPGFHERIPLRNLIPYLTEPPSQGERSVLEILKTNNAIGKEIADTLERFCQQALQKELPPGEVHAYWLDLWFSHRLPSGTLTIEQWSFCGLCSDLRQAFQEIFWQPYQRHIICGNALSLGDLGTTFLRRFFGLSEQIPFLTDKRAPIRVYIPTHDEIRPASFLAQRSWALSVALFLYKLVSSGKQSLVVTLQAASIAQALAQAFQSQEALLPVQVLSPELGWTMSKIAERLAHPGRQVLAVLSPRVRRSILDEVVEVEATGPMRFLNQRDPLVSAQMQTFARLYQDEGPITSYLLPQALLELKGRVSSPAKLHIILDSSLRAKIYRDEVFSLFRQEGDEILDTLPDIPLPSKTVLDSFVQVFSEELEKCGFSKHTNVSDDDLYFTLKALWQTETFRKTPFDQEAVVRRVFENADTVPDQLVIAATGGGKSLCFQLPAVLMAQDIVPKVTLIFSPLIALMQDQVKALGQKGIFSAVAINSTIPDALRTQYLHGIERGDYSIVYIAPEQIRSSGLRRALTKREVGLIAFDEAHCVSQWGHDFRTDYFAVKQWIDTNLCNNSERWFPLLALTATARKSPQSSTEAYQERSTVKDIIEKLGLKLREDIVVMTSPLRPELAFRVEPITFSCPYCQFDIGMKTGNVKCPRCDQWCIIEPETIRDAKLAYLVSLLTEQGENGLHRRWNRPYGQRQRGIIYCRTTNGTKTVAHYLQEQIPELRVDFYHAKRAKEQRNQIYQRFISDDADGLDIVVATNAFGMGIDVRRLGFVIHFDIPATPEAYYQEAGRAGRDAEFRSGKDSAQCILLYHEQDLEDQRRLIQQSNIEEWHIRAIYDVLCRIKDQRGADFLITEEELRLMAGLEENGPPIPSILYYLENHATVNGNRILERGESAAHLQQLAFEIGYRQRMADTMLSPLSGHLIEVFQTQLSLQERVLTMVDLHEVATSLNWGIDQLRGEIKNLNSKHILVPESHLYIRWAKRKREALQVIKTVSQDLVSMLQVENNLRRLKKGEEVFVDLHGLYKTGSLSALPSETFARFLAELARESAGDLQLFEYFELAAQHGRPGYYKLRLKSIHEVQQVLKQIYQQLCKTIKHFAHEQELIEGQKADVWDCIDLLQGTQDYEDRQRLLYLIHIVETLGLLETKGDEEKSRQIAMHISFKQPCRATDHLDLELFLLRTVQRAKELKLDLMRSYATAPQEQQASLFRDYFFGEIPLMQPFVMRADLTKQQRDAIKCTEGRHLVTGPAGSGKTRVLREHIRYLVDGMLVPPARILVVTHFQSANRRIENDFEDVPQQYKSLHLSTLNALGESIFKPNRHFLLRADGQPYYSEKQELTLLTAEGTQQLIYQALLLAHEQQETSPDPLTQDMERPFFTEQFNPDPASVRLCLRAISLLRQNGIFPTCSPTEAEICDILKSKKLQRYRPSFYYAVYLHYLKLMGENGWYTYDDQIVFALALLRLYPPLAQEIQNTYEHIIIDEFQDFTPAQLALVNLVGDAYGNIFAVGDEEQDIRVKEVKNLSFDFLCQNQPFEKHHLNINFRSVQEILDLAHSIRHPHNMLWSPQQAARGSRGELPTLLRVFAPSSPLDGENGISNHLLQAMVDAALYHADRLPEVDAGSIALIVAKANLLKGVQSYLQQLQYPFSVLQNTYKYQSFHVKRVLTYFRLILDNHQDKQMEMLLRYSLTPGLDWQHIRELKKIRQQNGQSLLEVVQDDNLLSQIGVTNQQIASLQQHINIFLRCFRPDSPFASVWKAISELENGPLTTSPSQEQESELEAVLRDVGQKTVQAAIDHIDSHISFVEEERPYHKLILTSIDHAKSQDFDTVFLLGAHLLNKIWANKKRLYVSISRARQRIFFLVDGNHQISENELLASIPNSCYQELSWHNSNRAVSSKPSSIS